MLNIAVIGCGVIGLTSAIELQKKFKNQVKVTIFADKFSPNTTSDIAAGLWEPYLLAENSEDDIIRWSKETYKFLIKLWKQENGNQAGICLQPVINLFTENYCSIPKWVIDVTLGYNKLSGNLLESFSKQYKQTFQSGFGFVSFTWEGLVFLPFLQHQFLSNKGFIVEKCIKDFTELKEYDLIVNCTGIMAKKLCNDEEIVPIRGQIIRVNAPWQKCIYMINSDNDENCCYIIPNKDYVILGGTKQRSYDTNISQKDSGNIIKNTSNFIPSLKSSQIIQEIVGLRPSRYKVRLEEEIIKYDDEKFLKIIHNYGHGGAGVTLSIGCAKDVTNLVEKIMLKLHSSKL